MAVFWAEFAAELVKYVFLIAIAVAGVFTGVALRKHKDKKESE